MARVDLVENPVKRESDATPVTPSELASLLELPLAESAADCLVWVSSKDSVHGLVGSD